ncbi:hypothetical protein PHYPO_G00057200 [Pangasianodon hypophthalmus]|uniref:Secreted peptide n=1 Tax=Pangasianodon hypophthalmus TaxID=310915 RepID=A0A5N5M6C7_PANHP|nr:hypothetical protein PHYPO_G00057200 [Pangasianodon hypophthalmus]
MVVVVLLIYCVCFSVSSPQSRWNALFEAEGLRKTSRRFGVQVSEPFLIDRSATNELHFCVLMLSAAALVLMMMRM